MGSEINMIDKGDINYMNTVNSNNFNETMDGYKAFAIDFMIPLLKENGYSDEQIEEIIKNMNCGFIWGKNDLTMDDARKYIRKIHL